MTLQRKILWILLALGASYAAADFAIQRFVVLPKFEALERKLAHDNVKRVVEALTYEIRSLERLCANRARDDAVVRCVSVADAELEEAALQRYLEDRALNLHFVIDREGMVRQGLTLDPSDATYIALHGFPARRWSATHPLLRHAPKIPRTAGVLLTSRGPLLLSARAIQNAGAPERAAGTLLLGRFLDYEAIDEIRARLHTDIAVQALDTTLSARKSDALEALRNGGIYVETAERNITAFQVFDNIYGEPALLLEATSPRDLMLEGRAALQLDTLTSLAAGLLVLLVLSTMLQRVVSGPLRRLTQHVTSIDRSTGLSFYDAPPVGDEIGTLGREFNRMIRRLKQDIREREKTEAALLEMRERMLRAEHLATLGEMGASVAHEIRNPLAGIRGAVQVMLGPLPEDDSRRPVLEEMLALVDRGEGTVRRLLDYAKPWEPQPQMADLAERIQQARRDLEEKGALTQCEVRYTGPKEVFAPHDPVLMRQVFCNLMDNAVQAMPEGGVLHWRVELRDDTVVLTLEDEGVGITPETEDKLFKPFFTTKAQGTGLGLAICRRIIEAHRGQIRITARQEGGACAEIILPKG